MLIRFIIRLKSEVLDPQGRTIERALHGLGYDSVSGVRVGKVIELDVADDIDSAAALELAREMAEKLLFNEVMEDYEVIICE